MNVEIKINTKQYDDNGKQDSISMKAIGTMYEKNNDIYIVYKEKEEGQETTSTIKISKDEVNIKKFGNINSTMSFKNGKTDLVRYKTVQGLFIIENTTNDLIIDTSSDKLIKIGIDYNIKIMDLFKGRNKISIDIKKIN